jgi:hypothetical protein
MMPALVPAIPDSTISLPAPKPYNHDRGEKGQFELLPASFRNIVSITTEGADVVRLLTLALVTGFLFPGCASTSSEAPVSVPINVQFYPGTEPNCPYEIIGQLFLELEGSVADYTHGNKQWYHDRLENEILMQGGHAVIEFAVAEAAMEQILFTGQMIRFKDPDCLR